MNLLVISTLSCVLEYITPILIKYITTRLYSGTFVDPTLRNDMTTLKQEMASLSMVDEFSKYAKLQRKYNKLETTMKKQVSERLSSRNTMQTCATYAFRLINAISMMVLLSMYRSEPVIILPKGTLWPIQRFLSWPSKHEDAISLLNWLIISRMAVSSCKKLHLS